MAKHRRGEKTAAVSEYLDAHPGAGPKEIAAALAKQRIKITTAHASNIKGKLLKGGTATKVAKNAVKRSAAAAAPSVVETPAKPNGTITLDQVKKVAHTIKTLGGLKHVLEVLEVIKDLGGVKKFKDLAEAMTVTGADAIPF